MHALLMSSCCKIDSPKHVFSLAECLHLYLQLAQRYRGFLLLWIILPSPALQTVQCFTNTSPACRVPQHIIWDDPKTTWVLIPQWITSFTEPLFSHSHFAVQQQMNNIWEQTKHFTVWTTWKPIVFSSRKLVQFITTWVWLWYLWFTKVINNTRTDSQNNGNKAQVMRAAAATTVTN